MKKMKVCLFKSSHKGYNFPTVAAFKNPTSQTKPNDLKINHELIIRSHLNMLKDRKYKSILRLVVNRPK